MSLSPRIYVACLAAYNNAKLHGKWIDADQSPEAIQEEITAMLKASPEPGAEEFAIHDFEEFGGIEIGEFTSIKEVAAIAEFLSKHGGPGAAWYGNQTRDLDDNLSEQFQDEYQGEWDSLEAYAENLLEDTGALAEIPEYLRPYFDVEAFARDMELSGDVWTVQCSGGIYVFRNS